MFNTNEIVSTPWGERLTVVVPGSVVTGAHQFGRPAAEVIWFPTVSLKAVAK